MKCFKCALALFAAMKKIVIPLLFLVAVQLDANAQVYYSVNDTLTFYGGDIILDYENYQAITVVKGTKETLDASSVTAFRTRSGKEYVTKREQETRDNYFYQVIEGSNIKLLKLHHRKRQFIIEHETKTLYLEEGTYKGLLSKHFEPCAKYKNSVNDVNLSAKGLSRYLKNYEKGYCGPIRKFNFGLGFYRSNSILSIHSDDHLNSIFETISIENQSNKIALFAELPLTKFNNASFFSEVAYVKQSFSEYLENRGNFDIDVSMSYLETTFSPKYVIKGRVVRPYFAAGATGQFVLQKTPTLIHETVEGGGDFVLGTFLSEVQMDSFYFGYTLGGGVEIHTPWSFFASVGYKHVATFGRNTNLKSSDVVLRIHF